jgi:hypothetical protein
MDGSESAMALRVVAAVAALVSAAVHLWLWFEGVRHQDVIGPAFMVNAVAGVVIAALLVGWRHWLPLLLVVGFGASTLGAFLVAWTVGLFGVHTSWEGWEELVAAGAEVVAIVAGLWAAYTEGWWRSLRRREAQH